MECVAAGTIRQMIKAGHIKLGDLPASQKPAQIAAVWAHEGKHTVVWERRGWRGATICWDATIPGWVNRESHYQAWRQLNPLPPLDEA